MLNGPIHLGTRLGKIVASLLVFELFAFLLYSIGLGRLYIIIGKYKKVSFACKSNGCDWPNEISVDILVRFCCSRLEVAVVLFPSFHFFAAIADESLYIVDEFNVVVCEIFLQCNMKCFSNAMTLRWSSLWCLKVRCNLLLCV